MKYSNEDIIRAFWQQGANNCASIALIKAAIETFGDEVFIWEQQAQTYHATLKNGHQVNFTNDQLQESKRIGSFQPSKDQTPTKQNTYNEIRSYAQLCFAVMVAEYNSINELKDFNLALKQLSNGANARFVSKYLGIENYASAAFRGGADQTNMIAWTHMPWLHHVVYMSQNNYDNFGEPAANVSKFPKRIRFRKEMLEAFNAVEQFSELNFINISKFGTFQDTGRVHSIPQDVDRIVGYIKDHNIKRILLNFHGGLVSENRGMDSAEHFYNTYKDLESTLPVSIVWETGIFEALPQTFLRLLKTDSLLRKLITMAVDYFSKHFGVEQMSFTESAVLPSMENKIYALQLRTAHMTEQEISNTFNTSVREKMVSDGDRLSEIVNDLSTIDNDKELQPIDNYKTLSAQEVERIADISLSRTESFTPLTFFWIVAKIVQRCISRFISKRGHGVIPTIIEEASREIYLDDFGSEIWQVMKDQAKTMWKPNTVQVGNEQFAGRYLLDRLAEYSMEKELEISIVAHSAGSIAVCNLVESIAAEPKKYGHLDLNKIIFLAPACRCDLFTNTIMKYKAVYKDFKMFTMSDDYESKDHLIQLPVLEYVYTRSLLYLISGILEGRDAKDADTYILGLDRHISGKPPYNKVSMLKNIISFLKRADMLNGNLILSKSPSPGSLGRNTTAEHHGGFGTDPVLAQSIKEIFS